MKGAAATKVRDIVGQYLNPPEARSELCVDEKSQIQALDRSAPVLPLLPGVAGAPQPRLNGARRRRTRSKAARHFRANRRSGESTSLGRRVPPETAALERASRFVQEEAFARSRLALDRLV